jgi:hypothetical protein
MPTAQKIVPPVATPAKAVAKPRRRIPPPRPTARNNANALTRGMLPLISLAVAALTILPTAIVVTVGTVPSLVALVVDDSRRRYLFRTVLGMNLAALWPFLERLWTHDNDVRTAMLIVADIYTWAAIYGAAGLGWMMYAGLPTVVESFKAFAAARRVQQLTKLQDKLVEEWGSVLPRAEDKEQMSEDRAEQSG